MRQENLVAQKVTYTLLKDGQFYIIENVPARVDSETGEQYFAPQTVEQLQQIIRQHPKPIRIVQTPVYNFS
jgi:YgiT-type zinc finger domain-containing protein